MSTSQAESHCTTASRAIGGWTPISPDEAELLESTFGTPFTFVDGATGEVVFRPEGEPAYEWSGRAELCREVAARGLPELIAEEPPLVVLAVPLNDAPGGPRVATGLFTEREVAWGEDLTAAAALGLEPCDAAAWAARRSPWPAEALLRTAELLRAHQAAKRRIRVLEAEIGSLSAQIASTYEEISLIYRLTQNLRISERDEELGRIALEWMQEVLPAGGTAIQLLPDANPPPSLSGANRDKPTMLCRGCCPVDSDEFARLIAHLAPGVKGQPVVVNRPTTEQSDWPCPQVRQVIVVPLAEGENVFGWLAAFNHITDGEFGTVEANLLSSVAAILGIHSGNLALYRQQAELMAGIIRALTAAIDAKDQYTCGHSDRVARVAVRLARELECDEHMLTTIYLSGLLHDIGKIGVEDSVLRKPGKLTDEEYEHIKRHSEIGHKILRDLKKLDNVLPVILHHHESWDGRGYPHQLRCEAIPLAARIIAVADSFDAMGSDRPYRKGMPDEKVDAIFRAGAGQQWDARVIEAFFSARDDIRRIAAAQQDDMQIDLRGWK